MLRAAWYPKKYCFGSFNIFWIFKGSKLIKVDGYRGNLSQNLRKVCSCMSSNTHDSTASSHSLIIPLLNLLRLSWWRISNRKLLTHKMLISVQVDFDGYDHVQSTLLPVEATQSVITSGRWAHMHVISSGQWSPTTLEAHVKNLCKLHKVSPLVNWFFFFTHSHLQAHVYTEKSSHPWDISQWTTQKCCITSRYYIIISFVLFFYMMSCALQLK